MKKEYVILASLGGVVILSYIFRDKIISLFKRGTIEDENTITEPQGEVPIDAPAPVKTFTPKSYKLKSDAPIYVKPDNKSSVVKTLKSGTIVNATSETVYFYKISEGYILKDVVTSDLNYSAPNPQNIPTTTTTKTYKGLINKDTYLFKDTEGMYGYYLQRWNPLLTMGTMAKLKQGNTVNVLAKKLLSNNVYAYKVKYYSLTDKVYKEGYILQSDITLI